MAGIPLDVLFLLNTKFNDKIVFLTLAIKGKSSNINSDF